MHDNVKDYYGKELQSSTDLKTNACCTAVAPPQEIRSALSNVHSEVKDKYYGCGLTIPSEVDGLRILDLGSGSGRDCYIAAQLVGEAGSVVGVDMTDEQLEVANKHLEYHREKFGFERSNVEFIKGNIETLDELNFAPESFDLIISNCVINLATNKDKVLADAFKLLKPGGEMYFSDVYSDRRIPKELQNDQVLWGECLSGALYWNDFMQTAKRAGFADPRVAEDEPITIENKQLEKKIGNINFYSVTYRLFKIDHLEYFCEDYGQAVRYKGSLSTEKEKFYLDNHHEFPKGKIMSVCGNTYRMLNDTRYAKHFDFFGDWSTHYGIYQDCGTELPFSKSKETNESAGGGCC
ncbi:methyltransferase type 11 [Brumimicrobium salinarum]|uniref:Arsenite methyltransferase n=1 Tax=Brumimicrobium salinarum TaxID=2058658 RepID=A0A2I0QZW5_9FLAO|nr:methyltransferase type 11 [Brumimicrobium salinarum]